MDYVTPELDTPALRRVAENQPEYIAVTAAIVKAKVPRPAPLIGHEMVPAHLLTIRPTPEERARIAAGEDIYLALLTFGGALTPTMIMCGVEEAAEIFEIPALPPEQRWQLSQQGTAATMETIGQLAQWLGREADASIAAQEAPVSGG